jgi:hypothetical protein
MIRQLVNCNDPIHLQMMFNTLLPCNLTSNRYAVLGVPRSSFSMTVKYDEELDMMEFGGLLAGPNWVTHAFNIDNDGKW